MFSKALFFLRRLTTLVALLLVPALLAVLLEGCISFSPSGGGKLRNAPGNNSKVENAYSMDVQQAPPREIQSIQLYRKGSVSNPPVISLESPEKLVLEFDYLGEGSKQFRVEVSHRTKSWDESPLSPNFYLTSFYETFIQNGLTSFSQRPSYTHYEFEFPDNELGFKVSGNYLLEVYDYDTEDLLFSLPFFVTENKGSLETRIEQLFARREDLRRQDQPFSQYRYPPFVEFPQFNLSYVYVQNQFWGRSKTVDIFDTATQGEVNFHLAREEAFIGNYEFNLLDLRELETDGERILSVQREETPPKVIMQRDVQNLNPSPRFVPDPRFGLPVDTRQAQYANVRFQLETDESVGAGEQLYLVGDFNNWTINRLNRMKPDSSSGLWEGNAFIKEGEYAYKYVVLRQNRIDDLALDQGFQFVRQEYLTFVYYKDPARNYDRLLQVDRATTN